MQGFVVPLRSLVGVTVGGVHGRPEQRSRELQLLSNEMYRV